MTSPLSVDAVFALLTRQHSVHVEFAGRGYWVALALDNTDPMRHEMAWVLRIAASTRRGTLFDSEQPPFVQTIAGTRSEAIALAREIFRQLVEEHAP